MAVRYWVPRWVQEIENQVAQAAGRQVRGYRPSEWIDQNSAGLVEREWAPRLDLYNTEDGLVGVARDSISISVEDGVLTVAAQRKAPEGIKPEAYHCCERARGTFKRAFILPDDVDADKASADYEDGVLTILLPKKEEAKPRKVQITAK